MVARYQFSEFGFTPIRGPIGLFGQNQITHIGVAIVNSQLNVFCQVQAKLS